MRSAVERLGNRYAALALRERALVLAAVLASTAAAWDQLVAQPLAARAQAAEHSLVASRAQVAAELAAQEARRVASSAVPDAALARRRDAVAAELAALDGRLAAHARGLVQPADVPRLLQQVLARHARVRLVSLRSLEPQPLLDVDADAGAGGNTPNLYRHGIEVELGAGYLDALRYLRDLEASQFRLVFQRVAFVADAAGSGRLTIVVHTLSDSRDVVGV
jgi:MSHA biogenesis protein MshJ